ncbi:hypothetical protein Hbut_1287 [Hyperthermus butylicus DSM 5456]|uniref:Uncharacterized protein n=1 Tax=Hyperthermus butylicus (strain DSM 5456 / JCM 9403 / PLM1-5) TaxID=415426 RepID=A2BMA6_HYPBU|nr:hypothetical protein Hbut_1287 [Hyperthermus butylicus DSM 5456]
MAKVIVEVDMAKYKHVDLSAQTALQLLEKIEERLGYKTQDVEEAKRYIRNFKEFYEYMRKKFKDYLAPPRRPDDYIRGRVVVDKIKLYTSDNGEERVVIIFDRRIDVGLIEQVLRELGFEVEVERAF